MTDGSVDATGARIGSESSTPDPGIGIQFGNNSRGLVTGTNVTGSFAAGIRERDTAKVQVSGPRLFDNNPNLQGA